MTKVFIIKTEDGTIRRIYSGIDYCQVIERLNNDLSACYFNWEVVKEWVLSIY